MEVAKAVIDALRGELSSTVVNAPTVPPEVQKSVNTFSCLVLKMRSALSISQVLAELTPYTHLLEMLGRLAMQLVSLGTAVRSVNVTYATSRDPSDLDTRVLRAMIIKGLLESVSICSVNLVNADFLAKQNDIQVIEHLILLENSQEKPIDFVQVQVPNVESRFASAMSETGDIKVEGRVKGSTPYLTKIGCYNVSVSLEGSLLLCRQVDQPGIIGKVGKILGAENVNVGFMSVNRTTVVKRAVMTIGLDDEPSKETLKKIGEINAIEELVFLKL